MMNAVLWVVLGAVVSLEPGSSWQALVDHAERTHGAFGKRAALFLAENRPACDDGIDVEILKDNLDYALRARGEFPWAKTLPEEIFLNDVLPYAVIDETRENWRPGIYAQAKEIVADCRTATEAAQALNKHFFNKVGVHYNTARKKNNQSPAESISQGMATCSGLSILLVDACRAVGVPARAVGVAKWNGKQGNHTWVEIWDGRWKFTGADEYDEKGLDRAWFVADARRAIEGDPLHAVWAASWKKTGQYFVLAWNPTGHVVPGVDVTSRYTGKKATVVEVATRHLRVWDRQGGTRLALVVRVVDGSGKTVAEVKTRGKTADLNDMPAIKLSAGALYKLMVLHDGKQRIWPIHAPTAGDKTLDLYWDQLGLGKDEAEALLTREWAKLRDTITDKRQAELATGAFTVGTHTMRIKEKVFGTAPPGARSLWISMHGGGGAPTEVNDQQWENQARLYEPAEGFYVAPRAPTDAWNLWHQAHIDPLFDRMIEAYVTCRGVDPNKVYLLGYSAGGDGVYQVAPRFADRLAAASMMAGHPNEAQPLGLRNLPFAMFAGGDDAAYDRNKVTAKWGDQLDKLQQTDPEGYVHRVTIYPGMGHWMERRDAEALPWMAQFVRKPWPDRVVWYQDDVVHTRFYWLSVAPVHAVKGSTVVAEVDGQTIRLYTGEVPEVTLRLRDALVDLDRPVQVELNGETVFRGFVSRTLEAVRTSLAERADPAVAATALLTVRR